MANATTDAVKRATTGEFGRMTIVRTGVALAIFATFAAVLQDFGGTDTSDRSSPLIAREVLRLEAARASASARPLIGGSHLPRYDAQAAIAREEAVLRQLLATRTATR